MKFFLQPGGRLSGVMRVPGDKSISHRSIILGSLAEGNTEVLGFLEGEDTLATMAAFESMGVQIERLSAGSIRIHGVGLHGLTAPDTPLNLGNSGTSMRLMAGILSAQSFDSELTGDHSLSKRPMERIIDPLSIMGAQISSQEGGRPPLKLVGGQHLKAINYLMPIASAQVKSCLLLAGLYADGSTRVTEPAPTRDHTERMLEGFGYKTQTRNSEVSLQGGGMLQATSISVPGDISSAAFFIVGALIAENSDLMLENIGINPTRTGIIDILRLMGGSIEVLNQHLEGGEPVADLHVRSSMLKGIHIPEALVPLAIDEFPAIFIAAACAEGKTVVTGAEELRVKESDRIATMAEGLQILGINAQPTADGMVINGGTFTGGSVESHDDHRIAMAFAIASLRATAAITINNCANVNTSFPGFSTLAKSTGLKISEDA